MGHLGFACYRCTSAFRPKSLMPDEEAKPDEVNAECRSTDAY